MRLGPASCIFSVCLTKITAHLPIPGACRAKALFLDWPIHAVGLRTRAGQAGTLLLPKLSRPVYQTAGIQPPRFVDAPEFRLTPEQGHLRIEVNVNRNAGDALQSPHCFLHDVSGYYPLTRTPSHPLGRWYISFPPSAPFSYI